VQEWKKILPMIFDDPKKHRLLRAPVLAGCWDACDQPEDHIDLPNATAARLVVRDEIEECRQWEESLTPPMRAARRGDRDDLAAFMPAISASPNFMDDTDSMGNDVWFWVCTGGSSGIIDQLLRRNVPLQGLVSNCLLSFSISWRRGVVVSGVRRMNEVNARRARLVPGWVTVFRRVYHLGM